MNKSNVFENCIAEDSSDRDIFCNWGDEPPTVFEGCTAYGSTGFAMAEDEESKDS